MNERIRNLMANPSRGLLILAWPVIISMLLHSLLHFVDFFFVGGLGPDALAGVQLAFPVFFLIMAVGTGIQVGSAALIAKRMGERNKKWAEETGLHALFLAIALAAVLTILGTISAGPVAEAFGGGSAASVLAGDYLEVLFAGSFIFLVSFALYSILQGEGDTKTVMKISMAFTATNIILDPLFIYNLGMGVGGAAVATVLAEAVSVVLFLWYIVAAKRSYLKIKPREFIYTPQIIKNILKVGIPSAFSQIGLSIAVGGINVILIGFGDLAVAAYGIGFRIDSLAILPVLGLVGGIVPMVGYFRGAKDFKGAKRVNHGGIKMALGFTIFISLLIFLLAGFLPSIFTSDNAVIAMATDYLRVIAFAYPFIGVTIIVSGTFQGLGKGLPSMVITLARATLLAIPLAYTLAYLVPLGVFGVWVGVAVSSVITAAISVGWIESRFKKLCGACGRG